jgi:hypothetical protein
MTMKIPEREHDLLKAMAAESGYSMSALLRLSAFTHLARSYRHLAEKTPDPRQREQYRHKAAVCLEMANRDAAAAELDFGDPVELKELAKA